MLFAIVRDRGNPGEGNKKLSPSPASRFIVTQMARLPPAVRYTSSLLVLNDFTENFYATAILA